MPNFFDDAAGAHWPMTRMTTVPAPVGGTVSGEPALIGNLFGIAETTQNESEDVTLWLQGTFDLDKMPDLEINVGQVVYWDDTNDHATIAPSGNVAIGMCIEDALGPAATVRTRLAAVTATPLGILDVAIDRASGSPETVVSERCTQNSFVALTPLDTSSSQIPFYVKPEDGFFDILWGDDPLSYCNVNSDGTIINASTTPVVVDIVENVGSQYIVVDLSANTMTTTYGGVFDFRFSMNGDGTKNTTYELQIRVGGVPAGDPLEITLSGVETDFSYSNSTFESFNAGDVIDFTIETVSGTGTLDFNEFSIQLLKIGYFTPEWTTANLRYLVVG